MQPNSYLSHPVTGDNPVTTGDCHLSHTPYKGVTVTPGSTKQPSSTSSTSSRQGNAALAAAPGSNPAATRPAFLGLIEPILSTPSAWRVPPPPDLPLGETAREAVGALLLSDTDWDIAGICYASARDAACWRLGCGEVELLRVLIDRFKRRQK